MTNFDSSFEQVKKLVEDFQSNESKFLSSDYQEAEVRRDFIDKFLYALGWDVYHNEQKNPYEQEVKVEKGVYVGKQQKRADYAFHLAPNFRDVKFYVEAKKPSRNLSNADDYFQSIRYGWNAGTQITFLTDFQEFHILDCRIKPDISSILNYKIKKYHYSDFLNEEKFSEIYWLLSREAVANNSLEKFAESLQKPKGKAILKGTHRGIYQSIDEAFLEELDEIRDSLAKAFKKANPHLESEPLTEMTQRLIDRLVFIRFLEDKQIEPDHYVSEFANSKTAWKDFRIASRKLDAKYNGVVFKKHTIDSDNFIAPDDKTFSLICEELAHVNSPYNFDIIPIHILGSIYERFLGKVVVATDKRVRIEEKPEVRKAGGVYYTPQYIVNYIVDNTVGKLIEGLPDGLSADKTGKARKTPKEISKMRFADISCGSGSFLITVFDRLLDHHRKWYQDNPEQAKKDGCYFQDGKWVLSLKQKQKILTNNIYGVDLDHQAVEVTQLSLYLKLLEDETTATAQDTWVMFKEQLLPNLNNNIVCGNSLIGTDILDLTLFPSPYQGEGQRERFDELKLKPMNFEDVFPEVMRPSASSGGGFDAIVGNPPYVRIQTLRSLEPKSVDYFNEKYKSAEKGNYDLYVLFMERSLNLIKENGCVGYILPSKFFTTDYGEALRKIISEKNALSKLVDFGHLQVFKNATTYTCLLFLKKSNNDFFKYLKSEATNLIDDSTELVIESKKLTSNSWYMFNQKDESLENKIFIDSMELLNLPCLISRGSSSGNDKVFCLVEKDNAFFTREGKLVEIETSILRVPLYSTDFHRYTFKTIHSERIIFPYKNTDGKFKIIQESELRTLYPKAYSYLLNTKKLLSGRKQFKEWYSYSAPRNLELHEKADILIPLLAEKGSFTLIPKDKSYCMMASGGFTITIVNDNYNPSFILGLVNSKLLFWFLKKISNKFRGGWITCTKQYFGKLPIKIVDLHNSNHKSLYDRIIQNVEQVIESKKSIVHSKTESEKEYLEKKCDSLDRQIDNLVYELYGLTEEEIKIVQSSEW